MGPTPTLKPPLIVDSDLSFLKSLATVQDEKKAVPFTAGKGKDAQLLLSDPTIQISSLFVNLSVEQPNGISVIRSAHQHRPTLPVYLIYDKELPLNEKDLRHLGIQKAIPKPISLEQITELLTANKIQFNADETIAKSKTNTDVLDKEVITEDAEFSAIRAQDFFSGSTCFFDVYVRFSSGKYVKILQSGDSFTFDRIESYLKKGVSYFYIRKEMQKNYLGYCDKIASSLISSEKAPMDLKISQTLNHGEEIMNFLNANGIDSDNLKVAGKFVSNVQNLVKQLNPDQQPILKEFLSDVTAYDHGVGVAAIAAMLLRPLNITSYDPVEAVGLSCMFHDIALKKLDPPILVEDESKMSPEQKKVYETHPTLGAKMLSQVKGIKPVVIQAVQQHHERRNKKGFPDHIGTGSISIVAEIVGISDEYFKFLVKNKENGIINVKYYLEHRIFSVFSTKLVTELKNIFKLGDSFPSNSSE